MELLEICRHASDAKLPLQRLSPQQKTEILKDCAASLMDHQSEILQANNADLERGKKNGLSEGLLDRLSLTEKRIADMSEGLLQVAGLNDPVGEIVETFTRPNGLLIEKCRVPIGVIGIIYEARPNVTVDAFALCFKSGNVVILKGGSDAICSNQKIVEILQHILTEKKLSSDFLQLITDTDRETTQAFMKMNQYVDLLIPRGGAGLIRSVVENSTIPVIETGTGNCHVYIDDSADIEKAIPIIINAKTQRISVCNACESLVIHKDIRERILPALAKALRENHVEMRGDEKVRELIPDSLAATEDDYGKEYLDYIISMKTVDSLDEAIAHINKYNTGHSDAIITENEEHAEQFLKEVDSACVYVNASTRFTDGFEFGFGAEIGISTQKMHARGPMGLKELTSYKYLIHGKGQIRE